MRFKDIFGSYGEQVPGYEVPVLNEREARAAAGLLFVGAFIGLTNGIMLQRPDFSRYFVTFFMLDFLIRVINPRYSPSLLLGRFFVRNQKPEYVGAAQKRFAWLVGFVIAVPMFWYLVIDFQPNPMKVLVCLICMLLLFFESAFSICLGCKIFGLIKKQDPKYCPGGVCEMNIKEPVQRFTPVQKGILLLTVAGIFYGTYSYFTKLEDKTIFTKKMKQLFLTQKELDELEYQKAAEAFDNDDDDF